MKIAIDIGSKNSGHLVRGIGVHTTELVNSLDRIEARDIQVRGVDFSTEDLSLYDLVHYPSFHPFFLTLPSKKPAKRVVVTIHDLIPLIYPKKYLSGIKGRLRFLEQKRRLRNVDAIITISETSKKDICRFLRINPRKVHVVYLAPKKVFKPLAKISKQAVINGVKIPEKFILFVGDVNYNKNLIALLKCCKELKMPVVIVGKNAVNIESLVKLNHPELAHLQEVVKEIDPNYVIRLGFVKDVDLRLLYNLAFVYCQPSFYEGFGLPILEAMACGCPVIASRIQAHVEITNNSCLYADPNKYREFVEKIWLLKNDSEWRKKLIKLGKENVRKFTWVETAKKTIEVYKRVLNAK